MKNTEPPLYARLWICLRGWKAWRTRRALDKAICLMIRNGIKADLAYDLMIESNALWDEAFSQHNVEVLSHLPGGEASTVG